MKLKAILIWIIFVTLFFCPICIGEQEVMYPVNNGLKVYESQKMFGLADADGNHLTDAVYDYISLDMEDGVVVVARNGLYGYVDINGNELIGADNFMCDTFEHGFGVICVAIGNVRIINRNGEYILPTYWEHIQILSDNLISAGNGDDNIIYSQYGEELFSVSADMIRYSNGFFLVYSDDVWQYLNSNGVPITDYDWEYLTGEIGCFFEKGMEVGIRAIDGTRYGICFDTDGNELWRIRADEIYTIGETYIPFERDGLWGYLTLDGKIAVDPTWEIAYVFENGYAKVNNDGKWNIIDSNFNEIFEYDISSPPYLYDNCIIIRRGRLEYLADFSGDIISEIGWLYSSDGFREGYMWVEGDDYTGYMDQQGHLNFANQWDRGLPFSNGMALVKKDGYYVKINTKGEIIASTNFIDIFTPYDGAENYIAETDTKEYYLIDVSGNILRPTEQKYSAF